MADREIASSYDQEIAREVLDHITAGGNLSEILPLRADGGRFPVIRTWWNWCDENTVLLREYAQARERQATLLFEKVLVLAEEVAASGGIEPKRAQVAIQAIQWAASKLNPQQYGERRQATPAVAIQIVTTLPLVPGQEGPAEKANPYVVQVKTVEVPTDAAQEA